MSDNPDRIYLEPDHAQIEGRMWCIDDDPASLGEPWTEYVRADLYDEQEGELFKTMDLATALTADRNEWVAKADKATALASEYLRERNRYREALEEMTALEHSVCDDELCATWWPEERSKWCCGCIARHALNREE